MKFSAKGSKIGPQTVPYSKLKPVSKPANTSLKSTFPGRVDCIAPVIEKQLFI